MTAEQHRDDQRREVTTGSLEQPAEQLTGPVLIFDLARELERLHAQSSYQQGNRNAVTLLHAPDFRIVLVAMKAGARLEEHHAAARLSLQTLSGRVRLQVLDRIVDLPARHLLVLEYCLTHDLEAVDDSVLLLTLAWPSGHTASAS